MKINSITIKKGEGSLFEVSGEGDFDISDKKINIFYMPNGSGKSLIFNGLMNLFSYNISDRYIKKTNKDLLVKIDFNIDGVDYVYESTYNTNYKITSNGTEVENFDKILKDSIGLGNKKLVYRNKNKSSLYSLNRFNFLDFSDFKDDEKSNTVLFIDSRYDGSSKKMLLSYILGSDIDDVMFGIISNYEYKKEFISKNKSKFEKYSGVLNQISMVSNDLEKLSIKLGDYRVVYGDIVIAKEELVKLKNEYIDEFGIEDKDGDIDFLNRQISTLEKDQESIEKQIIEIKESIKGSQFLEKSQLLKNNNIKPKDIREFERYESYKEYINDFDELKVNNYFSSNIDPYIKEYKNFLRDIYDIFVKKLLENNLIGEDDIIKSGNNIVFDEKDLKIDVFFKTSEGMRKTIRILSFIGLHIFSNKKDTKCLEYSFYDSFIENIDSEYRDILFKTIIEFINDKKLELPNMFFFITRIEKESSSDSIKDLSKKYTEFINLIDSNGIKY